MTTDNETKRHFCILDYFLDGEYLKWEEIEYECPVFIAGQRWTVDLENGIQVTGEIVETVTISENERRIMLSSC